MVTRTQQLLLGLLLVVGFLAVPALSFCRVFPNTNANNHRVSLSLGGGRRELSSSRLSTSTSACECLDDTAADSSDSLAESISSSLQRPNGDASSYFLYQPESALCDKRIWYQLCPPPRLSLFGNTNNENSNDKKFDVTLVWTDQDCPTSVAQAMLQQFATSADSINDVDPMVASVAESLSTFRKFCQEQHQQGKDDEKVSSTRRKYKARLLATRGPNGTKCPQWHIDHVPIRWIQCMVGPGCHMINGDKGVNWSAVNGLDDDDDNDSPVYSSVQERNQALVDTKVAEVYVTREQEAALLIGNRWNDWSTKRQEIIQPVVHKSPSPIARWEGRVLLTQDIVLEEQ